MLVWSPVSEPSLGPGRECGRARGLAPEKSQTLAGQESGGWKREPNRGTLCPTAENGVRETGAALGAPHQLHQLFSQFGHDGVPARGSSLSGHLPRNMGKGRFRRQEFQNGSCKWVWRLDQRKAKGEIYSQGPRLSKRAAAIARSFLCRKCQGHFRLLFSHGPHSRRARESPPRKRKWGREDLRTSVWAAGRWAPFPGARVGNPGALAALCGRRRSSVFSEHLVSARPALVFAGSSEAQALGPRMYPIKIGNINYAKLQL